MADPYRMAYSTASVEAAERSMSELYGPMRLTAAPPQDLRDAAAAVGDDDLVLARLLYSGTCRSGTDGFAQPIVACAVRGRHHWSIGRQSGIGSVPFFIPPGRWLDL